MSGILGRTVFYELDQRKGFDGVYRFCDWNTVITGLGTMMEPSQMVPRPATGGQLDWEDDAIKFNVMSPKNGDKPNMSDDESMWMTGYNLMPRKGR